MVAITVQMPKNKSHSGDPLSNPFVIGNAFNENSLDIANDDHIWIVDVLRDVAKYCHDERLGEPEILVRRLIWEIEECLSRTRSGDSAPVNE